MPQQPATTGGAYAGPGRPTPPAPISVDRPSSTPPAPGVAASPGASWMQMLSSTFLGDTAGGLFGRRQPQLTDSSPSARARAKNKLGLDATPTFKIALVGGSGVGKTSILRRWLQKPYSSKYSPTIGVDVVSVPFRYKQEEVLLSIWDVSSIEIDNSQSALHSLICDDLDGIFFVFNVHRVSSIAAVDKWRHSLAKYISAVEIPFFLLAHKADMIQKRIMSSDDIASYAKAAGYRDWMWTVGRPNFGENEKNPAVLEALERMVDAVWKERERKPRVVARPVGIFDAPNKPPLPIIRVDDDLHSVSASLLRLPTKTITTLPRGEDLQPIEEQFPTNQRASDLDAARDLHRRSSFGGNWVLGNEKGMYLRVTEDSVVADHEDSEEEDESEQEKSAEDDDEQESKDGEATDDEADEEKVKVTDNAESDDKSPDESSEMIDDSTHEAPSTTKAPTSTMSDHDAWRFFAGSISRARAEEILSGREQGTFLLRRKDAQTLILSYVGPEHVHHALIEFKGQRYYVGSAKSAQASFATLSRCLRSVRKYANRGLIFTRNTDFRVVNKEEMALEEDLQEHTQKLQVTTPTAPWRPGSTSSTPKTPHKRGASPKKPSKRHGLFAEQEHVHVPPKARIDEACSSFYQQLSERLKAHAAQQSKRDSSPEDESEDEEDSPVDVSKLLTMVDDELKQLQSMAASDAESQWRQFVKNMELWNRIVVNL